MGRDGTGDRGLPTGLDLAFSGTVDPVAPATTDVHALQAVLRVSRAVLGAQHFNEALEVIAEQSLVALGADSLSISRWESQRGVLRTLINVGELGPGEERWPTDEEYELGRYRCVSEILDGRAYVNSIDDDDDASTEDTALLYRLGKESELAVPVMHESVMWGELWAAGGGGRRFNCRDVWLLEAVAAQVSLALSRAERFSEICRYAYEDPLTGLANRRGLDQFVGELEGKDEDLALLICDLDGLKEVNDRDGHPAGDAVLRGVADVLSQTAAGFGASVVARVGGDEFCVVLPAARLPHAEAFARSASRHIAGALGADISLCWGAALRDARYTTLQELIAAADTALLDAKRLGPGHLWVRAPGAAGLPRGGSRPRRSARADRRFSAALIPRFVELMDQRRPASTLAALQLLACELAHTVNAAGWCVSTANDDLTAVRSVCGVDTDRDEGSGLRVVQPAPNATYRLADYPATAHALATGGAFVAAVDLEGSDSAEVALLRKFGYRAVLGIGVIDAQQSYLLEIYSDDEPAGLIAFIPDARVLAKYCVQTELLQGPANALTN